MLSTVLVLSVKKVVRKSLFYSTPLQLTSTSKYIHINFAPWASYVSQINRSQNGSNIIKNLVCFWPSLDIFGKC